MLATFTGWGSGSYTAEIQVYFPKAGVFHPAEKAVPEDAVIRADVVMDSDPSINTLPLWGVHLVVDGKQVEGDGDLFDRFRPGMCMGVGFRISSGSRAAGEFAYAGYRITSVDASSSDDTVTIAAEDVRVVLRDRATSKAFSADAGSKLMVGALADAGVGGYLLRDLQKGVDEPPLPAAVSGSRQLVKLLLDLARTVPVTAEDGETAAVMMHPNYRKASKAVPSDPERMVWRTVLGDLGKGVEDVPAGAVIEEPRRISSDGRTDVTVTVAWRSAQESLKFLFDDSVLPMPRNVDVAMYGDTQQSDELADTVADLCLPGILAKEYRAKVVGNPFIEIGDRLRFGYEEGISEGKAYRVRRHDLAYAGDLVSTLYLTEDYVIRRVDVPDEEWAGNPRTATVNVSPAEYTILHFGFGDGNNDSLYGSLPEGVVKNYETSSWGTRFTLRGRFPAGAYRLRSWNLAWGSTRYELNIISGDASAAAQASELSELSAEDFQ